MRKTLSIIALGVAAVAQKLQAPYAIPSFKFAKLSSNAWPSHSEWAALNKSIGGRLQALRPWAAVCYTSDPLYNPEECQSVISGYKNDARREADPAALLWTNWESCGFGQGCTLDHLDPQPVSNATCYQGSTPPYSFSILDAQDASTIVKWATAHNVKLTMKNTGHDYLGRSAAPSTLQVFTHLMDGVDYVPSFVPQGSNATAVPALTMAAGAQIYQIYGYAAVNNITPVVGTSLTLGGSGGFIQGGGHSMLSPAYGLAADNALEFKVVTADGQIRVANAAQNSDLFWAIRGGGPGSWGIVLSTTVRVYPSTAIGASLITVIPSPSKDVTILGVEFIALVAKYQNSWINTGITVNIFATEESYMLAIYWPVVVADVSDLYQFFDELKSHSEKYKVTSNTTSASMFPSISAATFQNIAPLFDAVSYYGGSNRLASRLVPQSYLDPTNTRSIMAVAEAIWSGMQIANAPLKSKTSGLIGTLPVVIMGGMPAATSQFVDNTGANPALYSAAWHVVYSVPWTSELNAELNAEIMTATHDSILPLAALGLKSSYQNEGDAYEPNWQEAFFGYKYAKLSSIKKKYDPANFFTTYKGVASPHIPAYDCYAKEQHGLL